MVVGKNTGVGQVSVGQDVEVVILTKDNTKKYCKESSPVETHANKFSYYHRN